MRKLNLQGKRYNRLTVISEEGRDKRGLVLWKCLCECGNTVVVSSNKLRTGNTTSCGCAKFVHGKSRTRLYRVWQQMKQRCNNPRNANYEDYGGRGIDVCAQWESFENFEKDMGKTYASGLYLERLNNDKGYSPENCVWANARTQQRNKRNTVYLTVKGMRASLRDWADITGKSFSMLYARFRAGWSAERIIFD